MDSDNCRKYSIELGALKGVPAWESHKRGRNWFAKITKDPACPGGLRRDFFERAGGEFYYLLRTHSLTPGEVVEFGADYYSTGGNPYRDRTYGVVIAITEELLELAEYAKPQEAFAAAKEIAETKVVNSNNSNNP